MKVSTGYTFLSVCALLSSSACLSPDDPEMTITRVEEEADGDESSTSGGGSTGSGSASGGSSGTSSGGGTGGGTSTLVPQTYNLDQSYVDLVSSYASTAYTSVVHDSSLLSLSSDAAVPLGTALNLSVSGSGGSPVTTSTASLASQVETMTNLLDSSTSVSVSGTGNDPISACSIADGVAANCTTGSGNSFSFSFLRSVIGSSLQNLLVQVNGEDGEVPLRRHQLARISNTKGAADQSDFSSTEHSWVSHGGVLYLSALNAAGNLKLFQYDGTKFTQISDLNTTNDTPLDLVVFNNQVHFVARNAGGFEKLLKISGGQIVQVSNINPSGSDGVLYPTVYSGALYFSAMNGSQSKLFRYDGSSIVQVSNLNGSSANDSPKEFAVYNGELYFSALNASLRTRLYKYSATSNVITQVTNYRVSTENEDPRSLRVLGDQLYFTALNSSGYTKIYSYRASSNTLTQVSQLAASSANDGVSELVVMGDHLYFGGKSASGGIKLMRLDPTTNQIETLSDVVGSGASADYPVRLTVFNDELYFMAYHSTSSTHFKLFKYAGEGLGIQRLSDWMSGGSDQVYATIVHDGALYMTADAEMATFCGMFGCMSFPSIKLMRLSIAQP